MTIFRLGALCLFALALGTLTNCGAITEYPATAGTGGAPAVTPFGSGGVSSPITWGITVPYQTGGSSSLCTVPMTCVGTESCIPMPGLICRCSSGWYSCFDNVGGATFVVASSAVGGASGCVQDADCLGLTQCSNGSNACRCNGGKYSCS